MKVGTRSLTYGVHCVVIHPLFVAAAWYRLYRWRAVQDPHLGLISLRNPLLWAAFVVHDWGYWGAANMNGEEGDRHPLLGARIMRWLGGGNSGRGKRDGRAWFSFMLFHSRYYAKKLRRPVSLLCIADKISFTLEPWWLYLPRAIATGELREYMATRLDWANGEPLTEQERAWARTGGRRDWFHALSGYLTRWAESHKYGSEDRWTSGGVQQAAFRAARRLDAGATRGGE